MDGGEIAGDLPLQQEPKLVLGDFTPIQSVLQRYRKIQLFHLLSRTCNLRRGKNVRWHTNINSVGGFFSELGTLQIFDPSWYIGSILSLLYVDFLKKDFEFDPDH